MLSEALQYQQGRGDLQVYLADFVAATAAGCRLRLRREGVPASAPAMQQLKEVALAATMREALRGELVVEFPRFLVRVAEPPGSAS